MSKIKTGRKERPKNISSVFHDPITDELHITFYNGAVYSYSGVSPKQHQEMMKSESLGEYFHAKIKDKHAYTKNLTHVVKKPSKK